MSAVPVFDPVIHAPGRLQICAILSGLDDAEFAMIRDRIGVSDSVLSKHLKQLEEAGYVALAKAPFDGRQPLEFGDVGGDDGARADGAGVLGLVVRSGRVVRPGRAGTLTVGETG